ncbi:hypothetical protein NFI00_000028 [Salmonella enterica]|nr:hypothetical protein [Salmonella enterica subsp. enterica serovar Minnesota]EJI5696325.1 hypothetical protein [Salmonella enterica]
MGLGYIDIKLDSKQEDDLIRDLTLLGIKALPKGKYHCTVMYDKRDELDKPLCDIDPEQVFDAHVVEVKPLGDALVFTMTSKDIYDEFRRLREAGYQHSFPELLVHMSICYEFSAYDKLKVEQFMGKWIGRNIQFSREELQPVKD